MKHLMPLAFLIPIALLLAYYSTAVSKTAACPDTGQPPVSFTLDGVSLTLCTTFIEQPQFVVSQPGNAIQVAYAVQVNPKKELLITTARYGSRPPSEGLPEVDAATSEEVYRAEMRALRTRQGGKPLTGPSLRLFGRMVVGVTSIQALPWEGLQDQPVRITEWVIKADDHLWIVRASQLDTTAQDTAALAESSLNDANLPLASDGLPTSSGIMPLQAVNTATDTPTGTPVPSPTPTPSPAVSQTPTGSPSATQTVTPTPSATPTPAPSLPAPAWWKGVCDLSNYLASSYNTQSRSSYPLGAVYRGMVACGPRPYADSASDIPVRFFPGAWGELEWECVELSMRFMYLAYGIPPYPANGNKVVSNYQGGLLYKIYNGTHGLAPQPDDVLSYCATCTVGHTAVVASAAVDAQGNGSVTVIEENNSPTGFSTLPVANWVVSGNSGPVIGWLRAGSLNNHTYLPAMVK